MSNFIEEIIEWGVSLSEVLASLAIAHSAGEQEGLQIPVSLPDIYISEQKVKITGTAEYVKNPIILPRSVAYFMALASFFKLLKAWKNKKDNSAHVDFTISERSHNILFKLDIELNS